MMIIDQKFEIGEIVYLKTDSDQFKRIVTAIIVCHDDSLIYELSCGTASGKHYDFEISREKDVVNA